MKNSIIVIDAGNTDIVIGFYQEKQLIRCLRKPTSSFSKSTFSEWLEVLVAKDKIEQIGIACVVPRIIEELLATCLPYGPLLNITPARFSNLTIKAENRNELGADFIASYYGAITKYQTPITLFDLGSATKTMVVLQDNEISGVAIRPGLQQSLDAMVANIPHLPAIKMTKPQDIIGHNTPEAIKAGVFYGELSAIKAYSELIDSHYNIHSTKILTGGYSYLFADYLPGFNYEPNIVLTGIMEICCQQQK